jgi:enoyl-CoA hydratase/carnithine racemase
MDWKTVTYEAVGTIARISLNRPETHNTMSAQLIKDLDAAVRHADADPAIRVIIIRGEGPSFSAGHDLSASPNEPLQEDFRRRHGECIESRLDVEEEYYYEANLTIRNVRKPTIAALKGHVVLGALMTALMCDLVVAEESTNLWNPSLRHTGTGGEVMVLPWEIGVRKTKEMLWTGDPLDVHEAQRLGMINRVVKDGTLDAECLRLAERIALMPPRAVMLTKRSLNKVQEFQGMMTAFEHHFLVHQLGHATREAGEWSEEARRRARQGGFRAWLEYRDGPFREQAKKEYSSEEGAR